MAGTSLEKLRNHFAELKQERRSWESYWRDIKDYVSPQRGRFLTSPSASEVNRGESAFSDKRLNGVASRALSVLASGMQSGLTSKARQWFLLTHPAGLLELPFSSVRRFVQRYYHWKGGRDHVRSKKA